MGVLVALASSATGLKLHYVGCFQSFVPAPGVPKVRALDHLEATSGTLTAQGCGELCGGQGWTHSGVTRGSNTSTHSCYCGCEINHAAPTTSNASCAAPCSHGGPAMPCGDSDRLAVYRLGHSPTPLRPECKGGLPPGPACSQQAAKGWGFCNVSLSLDARVWDLVSRIRLEEAGGLLTARQSSAVPRLGLPPFYWGTNAIHGILNGNLSCIQAGPGDIRCPSTFPNALGIATTWNRTLYRAVGRVIGREMRALANLNRSADALTSWAPTINIIRDPRWGRQPELPQ